MTESPDRALRWKKSGKPVTFVLPNSEVQPEVICESSDTESGIVAVYRVYEQLIRRIFGAPQIMALERDSARTIDGKVHILYEAWKAPHLPPMNRPTKYVFETNEYRSAPLYVCAPVQITIEAGSNMSAEIGLNPALKAKSGGNRSTVFNMHVSAPVDPTLTFEVVTADKNEPKELYEVIYRYAEDMSAQNRLDAREISEYIFKTYERYFGYDGGIVQVGRIDPVTIEEGQTATVPLEFTPLRSGYTLVVVSAVDEQGEQVFSDFMGLQCDVEAGTVIREF